MTEPVGQPLALPLAGERRERSDARANRERILRAARELLSQRGADGTSIDAVAEAAGVGKGTVFRRFGDRAGLIRALLDEQMRDFQDAFLRGEPPLGPGAPARERLEAFVEELLRLQDTNLELVLAAEDAEARMAVLGTLGLHVRILLGQIDSGIDADAVAAMLLGSLAPHVIRHLRRDEGLTLEAIQAGARTLLRGLTGP